MSKINQLMVNILGDETKKVVFDYVDRHGDKSSKRELIPTEIKVDLVGGTTPDGFRQFKLDHMSNVKIVKNVPVQKPNILSGDFMIYANGWYQIFNVGERLAYVYTSRYATNTQSSINAVPTNFTFNQDGLERFFGKFDPVTNKFGRVFTHKTLAEIINKVL